MAQSPRNCWARLVRPYGLSTTLSRPNRPRLPESGVTGFHHNQQRLDLSPWPLLDRLHHPFRCALPRFAPGTPLGRFGGTPSFMATAPRAAVIELTTRSVLNGFR